VQVEVILAPLRGVQGILLRKDKRHLIWFNQINETNQMNKKNNPFLALHVPRSVVPA